MVQRTTVIDKSPYYYESKVQSGGDTPLALRLAGKYLENNYSVTKESWRRSYSKMKTKKNNIVLPNEYGINSWYDVSVSPEIWPAEVDVLNKLAGKWRQTDLNVGMYLSPEGRESLTMMSSSLQKLANSAISLRRGDFGGFVRNLNELPRSARRASARKFNQGDISGSFLAAHLGWEPLIKDIYTLSEGVDLDETTHRISARKLGAKRTYSAGYAGNPAVSARNLQTDQKTQIRLLLDITRPPTFAQRFGLENPFLVAWELVPLSFVADYFLPIGSVIDSMGFISGIWGQTGWRKTYSKSEYKTWVNPGTVLGFNYSYNDLFVNVSEMTQWYIAISASRTFWTPNFADPFRSITTRLPSSVMKLGTLAALTHQSILSLVNKGGYRRHSDGSLIYTE
jgi:hypothetical protein